VGTAVNEHWEVEFAPNVVEDLEELCADPLDAVLAHDWLMAMERRLAETKGQPGDLFIVHTASPVVLGTVIEERLLGLLSHV